MDTTAELTWTPDLQLLTASEAAQLLKVSPKTVYVMIEREEIATVRFGRSVRIRKEDLEDFINSHLVGNNG
jgi:excisionase family DNA binding protein